jgi:hypothetical protein
MTAPSKNKRDRFLAEEDQRLQFLVAKHGTASWEQLAAEMPGRNARQCRERWKHYLSGDRSKDPWSSEEDRVLFDQMQTIGPRWTQLAAFFPGRTDIEVKARWMQVFAGYSNLHIGDRRRTPPKFEPTIPLGIPQNHMQFVQRTPDQGFPSATRGTQPHAEEYIPGTSRDTSFGSRSCFDFAQWGE